MRQVTTSTARRDLLNFEELRWFQIFRDQRCFFERPTQMNNYTHECVSIDFFSIFRFTRLEIVVFLMSTTEKAQKPEADEAHS